MSESPPQVESTASQSQPDTVTVDADALARVVAAAEEECRQADDLPDMEHVVDELSDAIDTVQTALEPRDDPETTSGTEIGHAPTHGDITPAQRLLIETDHPDEARQTATMLEYSLDFIDSMTAGMPLPDHFNTELTNIHTLKEKLQTAAEDATEPTVDENGLTHNDLLTAYGVLETVRESFESNDDDNLRANTVNEAHYMIQQYESATNWEAENNR
jgi:hypothetical protein